MPRKIKRTQRQIHAQKNEERHCISLLNQNNQKILKKEKKLTSKLKKKKRDVCHFQLGRKNWIVAMDNDSWNH